MESTFACFCLLSAALPVSCDTSPYQHNVSLPLPGPFSLCVSLAPRNNNIRFLHVVYAIMGHLSRCQQLPFVLAINVLQPQSNAVSLPPLPPLAPPCQSPSSVCTPLSWHPPTLPLSSAQRHCLLALDGSSIFWLFEQSLPRFMQLPSAARNERRVSVSSVYHLEQPLELEM